MSSLPPNESWRDIRPVALGVARRDDDLLVFEYHDDTADETFYRPPGGGLVFREPAREAIAREFTEELDWAVTVGARLAVLENIFSFEGTPGHEYDFVYRVAPDDDAVYERKEFVATESDGSTYRVCWKPLSAFRGESAPPLYPDGLLDVLAEG